MVIKIQKKFTVCGVIVTTLGGKLFRLRTFNAKDEDDAIVRASEQWKKAPSFKKAIINILWVKEGILTQDEYTKFFGEVKEY